MIGQPATDRAAAGGTASGRAASDGTVIDRRALDGAVVWINGRLRMHGGAIELVAADDERGHVEVRFTGMCCGCGWKATTWFGTVRPALESVPGVSSVSAPGTRVSEQAADRMMAVLGATRPA